MAAKNEVTNEIESNISVTEAKVNEAKSERPLDAVRIKIASPETIRNWSYAYKEYNKKKEKGAKDEEGIEETRWAKGEVTKPETINYRTFKPEAGGLFCERIFGPQKDWECSCGKYKGTNKQNHGIVCEKCHVQVTKASVRRERMGYIELAYPVAHVWYYKGSTNRIASVLGLKAKQVENIISIVGYVVLDVNRLSPLVKLHPELFVGSYMEELARVELEKEDKAIYCQAEVALLEKANAAYSSLKEKAEAGQDVEEQLEEAEDALSRANAAYNERLKTFKPSFILGTGAEAIKDLLQRLDLDTGLFCPAANSIDEDTTKVEAGEIKTVDQKKRDALLKLIKQSGNKPEWMVLDVLPVLPPDLRPMVQLDGGRFATSDLNDLYRHVISRNNRLRDKSSVACELVIRNEKRLLQTAVDSLLESDDSNRKKSANKRPLKSLSEILKGKQGRFRQNLLGKRVDYSGRSVIVVGPELKIYQCGLPKEMAIELFRPYVVRELLKRGFAQSEKAALKIVQRHTDNAVWDILEEVIHEYPVMLNRAPTLHRLSIQAFEPVLIEGKAIKLHPLACTAFNADFDGDQMAVHVPISEEAQAECRFLLLSPNNLLKPSDGGPVTVPTQDMVLGIYYLTEEREGKKGEGNCYTGMEEAIMAMENGYLDLHSRIKVRIPDLTKKTKDYGTVETTLGRLLFNEIIPQDLGCVDRSIPENRFKPEIDFLVGKKQLKKIIESLIDIHGMSETAEILDDIKAIGYHYSTRSAITVSTSDMIIPKEKKQLIEETQKAVDTIQQKYDMALLDAEGRYKEVVSAWEQLDQKIKDSVVPTLGKDNNIYIMATSGARGSIDQMKQLTGWRGLQQDTKGKTIELPILSSFLEGLNVLEYFMSAHGTRKGMSDTALRTADSGYLTRRLVDVAQEVIISEEDCAHGGDIPYLTVRSFQVNGTGEDLPTRIVGRVTAEDIIDPQTGEIVVAKNEMVTPKKIKAVMAALTAAGRDSIKLRTNLTCKAKEGVCAKCYGANMATKELVQVGEAVGIIAAQSIGEPGTQLTMRTFHSGGVAGAGGDITQGLPRVEEIFEAQSPKGKAEIAAFDGIVEVVADKESAGLKRKVILYTQKEWAERQTEMKAESNKKKDGEETTIKSKNGKKVASRKTRGKTYTISAKAILVKVDGHELKTGDFLKRGDRITEGPLAPREILDVFNKADELDHLQNYMLREVELPYAAQGVDINDKHIEIILRQMLKRVEILDGGDTEFVAGQQVLRSTFEAVNAGLGRGQKKATSKPIVLGITKASLATESFLSAASFQQTTQELTTAALYGKTDELRGIKENVLIGSQIPAGTGMKAYRNIPLDSDAAFSEAKQKVNYARAAIAAKKRREESIREKEKMDLRNSRLAEKEE